MLVDGDELVEWEVCKAATDPSDRRLYRHDVSDIRHPDAQHIAAFDPPTVLRLLDEVDRLAAEVERLRQCCALDHEHIEVAERERDRLAAEAGDLRTSTDHYASAASILRQERDAARAEVALRTVERDGAMAKVERVLAEHDHADTCGSILSPGAGYPCSCWRAALADRVERPDGHLSAANHVDGIRVPQGAETPSDRRTGAESGTPGVEGPMHERLTDVLVWFTPGDRAKAEEMARAVIEAGFRDGGQA